MVCRSRKSSLTGLTVGVKVISIIACKKYLWRTSKPPVKPEGAKIIVFHGEINPPDAVNGGGGKWYRYVLPSDWIKEAWQ